MSLIVQKLSHEIFAGMGSAKLLEILLLKHKPPRSLKVFATNVIQTKNKGAKMIRSKLAANVYAYRQFNKLSQDNLATKSGIDKSQIGNIENQRTSTGIDIVERLAIAFRIDPCLLLARPVLKMPGTGIKRQSIVPVFFTEGVAAYAF